MIERQEPTRDLDMKPGIGPRIEGRRILVTGGGTGIGAATARACAEAGMKVLVSGRRSEPLQRVVDEIVERGGVATFRVGDVAAAIVSKGAKPVIAKPVTAKPVTANR